MANFFKDYVKKEQPTSPKPTSQVQQSVAPKTSIDWSKVSSASGSSSKKKSSSSGQSKAPSVFTVPQTGGQSVQGVGEVDKYGNVVKTESQIQQEVSKVQETIKPKVEYTSGGKSKVSSVFTVPQTGGQSVQGVGEVDKYGNVVKTESQIQQEVQDQKIQTGRDSSFQRFTGTTVVDRPKSILSGSDVMTEETQQQYKPQKTNIKYDIDYVEPGEGQTYDVEDGKIKGSKEKVRYGPEKPPKETYGPDFAPDEAYTKFREEQIKEKAEDLKVREQELAETFKNLESFNPQVEEYNTRTGYVATKINEKIAELEKLDEELGKAKSRSKYEDLYEQRQEKFGEYEDYTKRLADIDASLGETIKTKYATEVVPSMKLIEDFNKDVSEYNVDVESFKDVSLAAKQAAKFTVNEYKQEDTTFSGINKDATKIGLVAPSVDIPFAEIDKLAKAYSSGDTANINALDVKKEYVKQLEEYNKFAASTKGSASVYKIDSGKLVGTDYVTVQGAKISQVPDSVVDTSIFSTSNLEIEKFKNAENTVLSDINRANIDIKTPSKQEYKSFEPSMQDKILFVDDINKQIEKDRIESYKQRLAVLPDTEKILMPIGADTLPSNVDKKVLKGLTNIYEAEGIVSQKPLKTVVAIGAITAGSAVVLPAVAAFAGAAGLSAGSLAAATTVLGASGLYGTAKDLTTLGVSEYKYRTSLTEDDKDKRGSIYSAKSRRERERFETYADVAPGLVLDALQLGAALKTAKVIKKLPIELEFAKIPGATIVTPDTSKLAKIKADLFPTIFTPEKSNLLLYGTKTPYENMPVVKLDRSFDITAFGVRVGNKGIPLLTYQKSSGGLNLGTGRVSLDLTGTETIITPKYFDVNDELSGGSVQGMWGGLKGFGDIEAYQATGYRPEAIYVRETSFADKVRDYIRGKKLDATYIHEMEHAKIFNFPKTDTLLNRASTRYKILSELYQLPGSRIEVASKYVTLSNLEKRYGGKYGKAFLRGVPTEKLNAAFIVPGKNARPIEQSLTAEYGTTFEFYDDDTINNELLARASEYRKVTPGSFIEKMLKRYDAADTSNVISFKNVKTIPDTNAIDVEFDKFNLEVKRQSTYQPTTAIEGTILQKGLEKKGKTSWAETLALDKEIRDFTENAPSDFLKSSTVQATRTAAKEQVIELMNYAKERPNVFVGKPYIYGTYSTNLQTKDFRTPGDVDFQLFLKGDNAEKSVNELVERLNKAAPSKEYLVKVSPEAPTTIVNRITGETVADIHSMDKDLLGEEIPVTSYGRNVLQPLKKFDDSYFSRLSSEGQAKGASIFSITEDFRKVGFRPKENRIKDVEDYFTIQKQLVSNMENKPDTWLNKLTGKTNKKKAQEIYAKLEALEAKYPKEKIQKLDELRLNKKQDLELSRKQDLEMSKKSNAEDAARYFKVQEKMYKNVGLGLTYGALKLPSNMYAQFDTKKIGSDYKYSPGNYRTVSGKYSSKQYKSSELYKQESYSPSKSISPESYSPKSYKPSSYEPSPYEPSKSISYDYKPYEPSPYEPSKYDFKGVQFPGFKVPAFGTFNMGAGFGFGKSRKGIQSTIKDRKLKKLYREIGL